jgi:hypothetical protein
MRRQISKRLETLERAADTEVFANALRYPIAYFLGGAKNLSEVPDAYARALDYHDLEESCRELWESPLRLSKRTGQARRELFAKFGYDLDRASPAAFADAAYRIVATLPDEWRAAIKSEHREDLEAEAEADQILKELTELAEKSSKHARRTKPRQGDRPKGK